MYQQYPFVNESLPYAYNALEPYIDAKTMELHHNRHLQTYIDNLNVILKQYPEFWGLSLEQLLCNVSLFPENMQTGVINNAGGVYNHEFYFDLLSPSPQRLDKGELGVAINKDFGSLDEFKTRFKKAALSVFGSGYSWLVMDGDGMLKIITTANQNTPLPLNLCPIINMDVWEHAYYLKHYNKRGDYIDDWFRVVNGEKAEGNYLYCNRRMNYMSQISESAI